MLVRIALFGFAGDGVLGAFGNILGRMACAYANLLGAMTDAFTKILGTVDNLSVLDIGSSFFRPVRDIVTALRVGMLYILSSGAEPRTRRRLFYA